MSKALLSTLSDVFVDNGIRVILATHSPSTVALAPEDSTHVLSRNASTGHVKVKKESRGEAIDVLSEGFMAIKSDDLGLLRLIPNDKIGILTEGNNTIILKRLLALNNITDVVVIEGREARTGDSQIKNFYDILGAIPHNGKILCVWDCDCQKHQKLEETPNLFRYIIPHNNTNGLVEKGIENAFSEEAFDGFKITHARENDGKVWYSFDGSRKSEFADAMSKATNIGWFSHFSGLLEKIEEIRKN